MPHTSSAQLRSLRWPKEASSSRRPRPTNPTMRTALAAVLLVLVWCVVQVVLAAPVCSSHGQPRAAAAPLQSRGLALSPSGSDRGLSRRSGSTSRVPKTPPGSPASSHAASEEASPVSTPGSSGPSSPAPRSPSLASTSLRSAKSAPSSQEDLFRYTPQYRSRHIRYGAGSTRSTIGRLITSSNGAGTPLGSSFGYSGPTPQSRTPNIPRDKNKGKATTLLCGLCAGAGARSPSPDPVNPRAASSLRGGHARSSFGTPSQYGTSSRMSDSLGQSGPLTVSGPFTQSEGFTNSGPFTSSGPISNRGPGKRAASSRSSSSKSSPASSRSGSTPSRSGASSPAHHT